MLCILRRFLRTCQRNLIIENMNKEFLAEEKTMSLEKTMQQYRKELLACNTVSAYKNIEERITEISGSGLSLDKEFKCCGNAKHCSDEYKNTKRHFEIKINNLKMVINATEQMLKVMKQMDSLIDLLKDEKHVYLRFALDRNDEMVGFILDYKNVFDFQRSTTLYGVIGSNDFNKYSNQGRIYMFLDFYIESEVSRLNIVDFFVNRDKTRCYHGTLTLETLLEAVKVINVEISFVNSGNSDFNTAEISEIYGSIRPHESYISRQGLYKFYEKNGFIEEGKLLKRIRCSTDKI